MDQHLAEGHSKLPLILNVCLYAGPQTPYPYSTDIYDCFELPALAREKMFKPLQLIDLTIISQEQLATYGQADLVTILLKQAVNKKFLTWIKENTDLIKKLLNRLYVRKGIIYILDRAAEDDANSLIEAIIAIDRTKTHIVMSAAEQLRYQGEIKGRKQGEIKGRKEGEIKGEKQGEIKAKEEVAKNMLQEGIPISTIKKVTGLSEETLKGLL